MPSTADLALVDHHCHGLVSGDLANDEFRLLGTESDWPGPEGTDSLDSPFGLAVRAICGPLLGVERHAPLDEYLNRRRELGHSESHRLLMASTGTARYLVDTGFTASPVGGPAEITEITGQPADEILRLERVAEEVAPSCSATDFPEIFRDVLHTRSRGVVGLKSIIAYRYGFDISPVRPDKADVTRAAGAWLSKCEQSGSYRLDEPVLLQFLLWEAVETGLPIQMHTGYGDGDVQLFRADPSRMTKFLTVTRNSGARFMLLHCYPFVREAAILAQLFPHVYCDVGLVSHYLGPSSGTAIRHALEIAPFGKVLYSSDAYGLAEHYAVSARQWRRELGRILDEWVADDWLSTADAERYGAMIASGNAERVYGLKLIG